MLEKGGHRPLGNHFAKTGDDIESWIEPFFMDSNRDGTKDFLTVELDDAGVRRNYVRYGKHFFLTSCCSVTEVRL